MRLRTRFTLVLIVATTLISLLIGGYAVIATKNSQLSVLDHNLNQIILSTKGSKSDAIGAALLAVHQNNFNAVVDFVNAGTISQLSLATFNVATLPRKALLNASVHSIQSSTDGGGIRFRTVALPGGDSLFIAMSSADVKRSTHNLILRLLLFTVVADLLMSGAAQVVIRRDTKKIEELIGLANDIADKNEDVTLPETSGRSDVDQLSSALGRMVGTLNDAVVLERNISQRMQQFLGDASHELRTPLTVIRGYTELLRSDRVPSPEVQLRALDRMGEEVQRMERLISDLLLLTELGEQRAAHDERIDVSAILHVQLTDFRTLEPHRAIHSQIDKDVTLVGSKSRVERLLQNLFSNIRRHTPANAPVRVILHTHGETIELWVEDGGPGLPESAYESGPQGFMRFDKSRSRESGGSGLGMSIIAAVVKDLNGSIDFHQSSLGGLGVCVRLPITPELSHVV
ncbi:MAG: histidine kinase dimerization/phospho-acceptor domain-containing protein [Acidimicrobiales bacterium]